MSFIYEFLLPSPPFPFSHPTVNMEIVFVSFVCIHARTHCISIRASLCGDLLMSVFLYRAECKLVPRCLRGCGGCRRVRWPLQRKLHCLPSINYPPPPNPHPVAVLTVNHLSSHTCSLPQLLPLILLKTQPDFYYHYYSELPLSL